MSPEKKKKLLIQVFFRFCLIFGVVAGFYLYQHWQNGGFGGSVSKKNLVTEVKDIFVGSGKENTFEFPLISVVDRKVEETGGITYRNGRTLSLKNIYKVREKRNLSNQILTIEGKTEGEFDPLVKSLMKNDTYLQKIDLSASYCPADFVPHYPSSLRNFIYFMPRNPLFDGQKWELVSCGGKFSCSYSVSMKDTENPVDISCSGYIGETKTALSGTAVINGNLDGFSQIKMEMVTENKELTSIWNFYEEISTLSKLTTSKKP